MKGICALVAVLGMCMGCSRSSDGLSLIAPFNEETKLGELTAVWKQTGEEREFAHAVRLKEPEVEVQFRVDVSNEMNDPIFVRLTDFVLQSKDGLALATEQHKVECTIPPGRTQGVLYGSVWVTKRSAEQAGRFDLGRFAVPLSERGRGLYRQWLLERRPGQEKEIDAELQAYAAAPACTELAEREKAAADKGH